MYSPLIVRASSADFFHASRPHSTPSSRPSWICPSLAGSFQLLDAVYAYKREVVKYALGPSFRTHRWQILMQTRREKMSLRKKADSRLQGKATRCRRPPSPSWSRRRSLCFKCRLRTDGRLGVPPREAAGGDSSLRQTLRNDNYHISIIINDLIDYSINYKWH